MTDKKLKIVYWGSPDFAVPCLRALHARHDVVAVVTQPDRPRGRGRSLARPAVKVAAEELGIPVLQPEKIRRKAFRLQLADLGADLFVVAAYGKILRPRMLAVPPMGCVNVHASLLPSYRGSAPIQWAVIGGERRSGITIMLMDAGMDTGPMLLSGGLELTPDETAGSLHDRLAELGPPLLLQALDGLAAGTLEPEEQDHERATEAPMLTKEHGQVDFSRAAEEVDSHVRGMDPWPGAYTTLQDKTLKLFASSPALGHRGRPGEVLGVDDRGLLVACGEGAVWIGELQRAGRKRMDAQEMVRGYPVPTGTVLGKGVEPTRRSVGST